MGKYFGTDGIRGQNEKFTKEFITTIGDSLIQVLKKNKETLKILIGGDTRSSTYFIISTLIDVLNYHNVEIINVGILPTPGIGYLTSYYECDAGIVVTASHNPSTYNGIKILNGDGEKLTDEAILEIESAIDNFDINSIGEIDHIDLESTHEEALKFYFDHLISLVNHDLKGLKIGLDCANGATSVVAYDAFKKLGADVSIICDNKDYGNDINNNCGSTHLKAIKKFVTDNNLDFGCAFDGDGDRCLLVDNKGTEIDGDHVLAIYGKYLKEKDNLTNNKIAATVMCNQGLFNFAKDENIDLVITDVGDANVYDAMKKENIALGGEESGHIIMLNQKMGDGILTALIISSIAAEKKTSLEELAKVMKKTPQVKKTITATAEGKIIFKSSPKIKELIKNMEDKLEVLEGRLLARASGTEDLIRITMWGNDTDKILNFAEQLGEEILLELN